ncbi:hypothetical protein [Chitinophaga filiformis]|uniref:Uncharacterized protein n=1 Tax=Chitinophaga filiformis TaxID=104663 RepID=A0ABY4I4U5_CHIFI|nr:hypothetical protein [Chitinophaga filiformis]UPK69761.1 hypothetical protein MYF79_00470 [Chitinophaga filiformis]
MKNVRFALMAVAVTLAAGTAVATSMQNKAERAEIKYYKTSTGEFAVAGIKDYDYVCAWDHFGTCTYTFDSATGTYKPSEAGKILFLR